MQWVYNTTNFQKIIFLFWWQIDDNCMIKIFCWLSICRKTLQSRIRFMGRQFDIWKQPYKKNDHIVGETKIAFRIIEECEFTELSHVIVWYKNFKNNLRGKIFSFNELKCDVPFKKKFWRKILFWRNEVSKKVLD